jgi:hypothetical protein
MDVRVFWGGRATSVVARRMTHLSLPQKVES